MKRTFLVTFMMIFSMSAFTLFAQEAEPQIGSDAPAVSEMTAISDAPVATEAPAVTEKAAPADDVDTEALKARVDEIRDMDKSELSRAEKRELRNELKDNKAILQSRGIYIGGGTLILIIILIILLT